MYPLTDESRIQKIVLPLAAAGKLAGPVGNECLAADMEIEGKRTKEKD